MISDPKVPPSLLRLGLNDIPLKGFPQSDSPHRDSYANVISSQAVYSYFVIEM